MVIFPSVKVKDEIELMVFPFLEDKMVYPSEDDSKTMYEFHLVSFKEGTPHLLKKKTYKAPIDISEVAKEFGVSEETIREMIKKIYQK
jgi:transcriptional antiterminator